MKIDLQNKISEHYNRLERLAIEAEEDDEEKYSSRVAAMNSLSNMLKELTNNQERIINMKRLMRIETVVIEVINEYLSNDQKEVFMTKLEERLQFDE